jgi:hypothetical protein
MRSLGKGSLVAFLVMASNALPGVELRVRTGAPLEGVFFGLVILVIGEILRRGGSLQEEQDLTV